MNRRDFIKILAAVPALAWLKPEVPKAEPDVFFDIVEAENYSPSLAYFDTQMAEVLNRYAQMMGYENFCDQRKDFGQKIFSGLSMGLKPGPIDWEVENST